MEKSDLTRRTFLQAGAGALALLGRLPAGAAPAAAIAPPSRPLRSHRNLFNGDCNFLFYNPELWQPEGGPFSAQPIHRYIGALAQGGIDTLLVNPNSQVVWYPSKKVPTALDGYRRGDRAFARRIAAANAGFSPEQVELAVGYMVSNLDLYYDLIEAKVDWLAESAQACRAHGISPWLSYRMNDTHGAGAPESPVNFRLFREAKNRLSGRIPGPGRRVQAGWIGMNYAQQEVRDAMKEMIREGIEAYDFEGLELDWLRHPVCLEAPATAGQIAMMTDWFGEVAALARQRRPDYPVGMRVPSDLAYLQSIGIDLKELVRRRTVDFLTFSNFWQTAWEMPFDQLRRELGSEVVLYGGMEDAPNWLEARAPALTEPSAMQAMQLAGDNVAAAAKPTHGPQRVRGTRYLSASAPLVRGNAAGKLVLGVDGLEQFNYFVTDQVRVPGQRADFSALHRLDDLAFLRGQEKHYAFNTASVQSEKIWDQIEQLPVTLPPGHRRGFRLPMCAEPPGPGLQLIVQVVTQRADGSSPLGVSFNGAWPRFTGWETEDLLFPAGPYTQHVDEHAARNTPLGVEAICDGWNEVVLYNESARPVSVVAIELAIKRAPAPA